MDIFISTYLNNLTKNDFFWDIIFLFADFPIFIIPIFLLIFWLLNLKDIKIKQNLLNIFYSSCLTTFFAIIIQHIYFVERPMSALKNAWNLILSQLPNASFPSDHAWVSASFLAALYLFWYKNYFFAFLPFFIIMNLSRIAWWVHWFSDIIWWIVLWILSSIIIYKFRNSKIITKTNIFLLKIASYLKL